MRCAKLTDILKVWQAAVGSEKVCAAVASFHYLHAYASEAYAWRALGVRGAQHGACRRCAGSAKVSSPSLCLRREVCAC